MSNNKRKALSDINEKGDTKINNVDGLNDTLSRQFEVRGPRQRLTPEETVAKQALEPVAKKAYDTSIALNKKCWKNRTSVRRTDRR